MYRRDVSTSEPAIPRAASRRRRRRGSSRRAAPEGSQSSAVPPAHPNEGQAIAEQEPVDQRSPIERSDSGIHGSAGRWDDSGDLKFQISNFTQSVARCASMPIDLALRKTG